MHRQINKVLMLYSEEIVKKRLPIMLTSWENLRIINMENWQFATGKKRTSGSGRIRASVHVHILQIRQICVQMADIFIKIGSILFTHLIRKVGSSSFLSDLCHRLAQIGIFISLKVYIFLQSLFQATKRYVLLPQNSYFFSKTY